MPPTLESAPARFKDHFAHIIGDHFAHRGRPEGKATATVKVLSTALRRAE
ncbi:hypothetical protein ACFUJR_09915 [Streptomyces sp. NPDC057271]